MKNSLKNTNNEAKKSLLSDRISACDMSCEEFYSKYRPIILRDIKRFGNHDLSPEDITQDALLLAWQNLKNFRGDSNIKTYILSIARSCISKRLKHLSSRQSPVSLDEITEEASNSFSDLSHTESQAYRNEIIHEVRLAISQLTPKQAQAVELFYLKEMPQKKAAKYANCPLNAFENRCQRGCKRLRKFLEHLKG